MLASNGLCNTRVEDYLQHVRHVPRLLFVQAYKKYWFLCSVLKWKRNENVPFFDTDVNSVFTSEEIHSSHTSQQEINPAIDFLCVYKFTNITDERNAKRIYVGRATTNDITIAHMSISKLHACFYSKDSSMIIRDLGSRNGTFVNKRQITLEEAVQIDVGSEVTFGVIPFQIYDSEGFYDLLSQSENANGSRNSDDQVVRKLEV